MWSRLGDSLIGHFSFLRCWTAVVNFLFLYFCRFWEIYSIQHIWLEAVCRVQWACSETQQTVENSALRELRTCSHFLMEVRHKVWKSVILGHLLISSYRYTSTLCAGKMHLTVFNSFWKLILFWRCVCKHREEASPLAVRGLWGQHPQSKKLGSRGSI